MSDSYALSCTHAVRTKWNSTAPFTPVAANQAKEIRLQCMQRIRAWQVHVLTWLWWSMYWHFWPREIGGEKVEEKTGSWGCRGGWRSERKERKGGNGRLNDEHADEGRWDKGEKARNWECKMTVVKLLAILQLSDIIKKLCEQHWVCTK